MILGDICLMREFECNRALLTMALISGADVSIRSSSKLLVLLLFNSFALIDPKGGRDDK